MTTQWQEIHGFGSPSVYESFVRWLEEQIRDGNAVEVQVLVPYGMPYSEERWVRQGDSGPIWRLVSPDYPFRGVFKASSNPASGGRTSPHDRSVR
jgi:hypothetical protein